MYNYTVQADDYMRFAIAIYGPMIYGSVCNGFDAGKSITRASGRGLGPGNRDFFGPCEMASSRKASAREDETPFKKFSIFLALSW
jgi:hypothetical protein